MGNSGATPEVTLEKFDQEFKRWRSALDAIGIDRMEEPGVMGEWSAKQLVAHVSGWQWKTLASMQTALSGGAYPPTPWPAEFNDPSNWEEDGDVEPINEWIHDDAEPMPPGAILSRSLQLWQGIRSIISGLSEAQVNDPNLFPRLGGASLADRLSEDGLFGHVREHLDDDVYPWLEQNGRRTQE
jgi:hypothetical protein